MQCSSLLPTTDVRVELAARHWYQGTNHWPHRAPQQLLVSSATCCLGQWPPYLVPIPGVAANVGSGRDQVRAASYDAGVQPIVAVEMHVSFSRCHQRARGLLSLAWMLKKRCTAATTAATTNACTTSAAACETQSGHCDSGGYANHGLLYAEVSQQAELRLCRVGCGNENRQSSRTSTRSCGAVGFHSLT